MAPALLDVAWQGAGRLILFLEHLRGRTLDLASREIPRSQVPLLAQAICEQLGHLHRAGWIHADLKPENVLVLAGVDRPSVRLLDFGYAIDRYSSHDPRRTGGTPPFMAPELLKGWMVDGRADFFSLGAVLSRLFPSLPEDPKWAGILSKLTAEIPGDRHQSARELIDEIERAFGLEPSSRGLPRFGLGPLVGRTNLIQEATTKMASRDGACLLVQGRPGTGISRFLAETVLGVAAAKGPPVRILDLSGSREDGRVDRALGHLWELSKLDGILLCGIDDPSPGLRWLDSQVRDKLLQIVSTNRWQRFSLPPLDATSYQEIVSTSLGRPDEGTAQLGLTLYERTEGDLRQASQGFERAMRACAREEGAAWRIDPARLDEALPGWEPDGSQPVLDEIPRPLAEPLHVCARAGSSFSGELAKDLLLAFGHEDDLTALLEYGYLTLDGSGRICFLTQRLWTAAKEAGDARTAAIDSWLNVRLLPDPERVEQVLHVALLARRLGAAEKEARVLSESLSRAHARRRWSDVARLFSYPDGSPGSWTMESVRAQISRLTGILGREWSQGRLLCVAGMALKTAAHDIRTRLLESAASGPDVQAATEALLFLADRTANDQGSEAYERYRTMLQERQLLSETISPGVLKHLDARRARARGQRRKALALAEAAADELRGSGPPSEGLNLQLLASLKWQEQPEEVLGFLETALGTSTEPEDTAQIRYNLSLLEESLGRFESAAECVEAGIQHVGRRISPVRLTGLRLQRAWNWANLDRIEVAQSEAFGLLRLPVVRFAPSQLSSARMLLGYCHLHRGSELGAIRESVEAWMAARAASSRPLQAECLRGLVDVLVDLGKRDVAQEHADEFRVEIPGEDPAIRTTNVRTRALLAEANGKLDEAARLLREHLDASRKLPDRLLAARYLHHLGLVRSSQGAVSEDLECVREAVRFFDEELDVLVTPGHGYYRARALLALSCALRRAGNPREASKSLSTAISLSRSVKARGLLHDCLNARSSS